jgi:ADP-heptose:LPS heptosyltransferase
MVQIIDKSQIRRILVIQFETWGDVLLTTSYLDTLKKAFPNAEIDFLVSEQYTEILYNNPNIRKTIAVPKKGTSAYFIGRLKVLWNIRKIKYDIVINQQDGSGSAQVVLFSGARYKLGWGHGKWGFIHNCKATLGRLRYHASVRFDILSPLGITEQPYKLFYYIKNESYAYIDMWLTDKKLRDKRIVVFSPGGPEPTRKWDIRGYAALADSVRRHLDVSVVILWAPRERADVDTMVSMMNEKAYIAPATTFNQAAALLKRSFLLICNNGALLHLSVATETPALAIFGHSGTTVWSPQGAVPYHYHMRNHEHRDNSDNTFGIKPEDAFAKVRDIFGELDGLQ